MTSLLIDRTLPVFPVFRDDNLPYKVIKVAFRAIIQFSSEQQASVPCRYNYTGHSTPEGMLSH